MVLSTLLSNIYSEHSLLQSGLTIKAYVQQAKQLGYKNLALTDKHTLSGVYDFLKECEKVDMKPLVGLECTVLVKDVRLTVRLLAKNKQGYQQLVELSSAMRMSKENGISYEVFQQHTTACIVLLSRQSFTQAKDWHKRWLALTSHSEGRLEIHGASDYTLIEFAEAHGIVCVAAPPIRFLKEENYDFYRLLTAIGAGTTVDHVVLEEESENAYLLSLTERKKRFSEALLQETDALADKIETFTLFQKPTIPRFDGLEEKEAHEQLQEKAMKGFQQRYQSNPSEEAMERLEKELNVIKQLGFASYFLIVADFMNYAHRSNILTGPGRGSSASSIVAYALRITDVDPLKHGLLFERFLNPERISLPDIDIDFPDYRRDDVIQYVRERFGNDHVAQVLTFGTFAGKASIRDAGKAFGLNSGFVDRVAKAMNSALTLEEAEQQGLFSSFQSTELDTLLFFAKQLEGMLRHESTHAAGVIISDRPLKEKVALQYGSDERVITQADMDSLDALGYVKFDFLGLKNLTLLEQMLRLIEGATNQKLNLRDIPFDDEKTFRLLQQGESTGIFQLESDGMRRVLKQLKPSSFNDIVATTSLYRPGPMTFIKDYIQSKHEQKKTFSHHVEINRILQPTFGVIVYQEQIIQLIQISAGYSLAEADIFRRAISKKQRELMNKDSFVERSIARGYTKEEAETLFTLIEKFSNYGFPKSHATAYSMISYWLAYLRVHYQEAFFAALCSANWQDHQKLYNYIYEARKAGVEVLPPSIQDSHALFTVEKACIRFGLLPITTVNRRIVDQIKEARTTPFQDFFTFVAKVYSSTITQPVLTALIKAGACDHWGYSRAVLLANVDKAIAFAKQIDDFKQSAGSLFTINPVTPAYIDIEPSTKMEEIGWEREVLGFYFSGHPIENEKERLAPFHRTTLIQAEPSRKGIRVGVLVKALKKITTKKGKAMAFFIGSDETEECECVVFPTVWKDVETVLTEGSLVLLHGVVEEREGKKQFIVQKAIDLNQLPSTESKQFLHVYIEKEQDVPTKLSDLKYILSQDRGTAPVILYRKKNHTKIKLPDKYAVQPSKRTIQLLKRLFGEDNVRIEEREDEQE
ncbi:DNA polymerase III alpha subunit [Bacillus sp. JCM 19047]|nr:DNA polymerase III alpha subunit [Bacillus sp. JCM 19047]